MTPPGAPSDPSSADPRGESLAVPPPGQGVTIISGKPDPDAVGLAPTRRRRRHGKRFRPEQHRSREHRRRRRRRLGRRAYIRSVFALPSLATLGNAVCGFASVYVASLDPAGSYPDPITRFFASNNFVVAAYLVFVAMICDALDGRLARFARHTTDFGGQLDSLADVISFGVAPAFLAIQVFKAGNPAGVLPVLSRLIWAISALYMSCAAVRLARFNVSNSHGEQAHFSFLGLPSPGAGGAVMGFVLLQQELHNDPFHGYATQLASALATTCTWLLPLIVLSTGLLMVSNLRYGHMVNRYLRGRRSIAKVIWVLVLVLLFVVAHRYVIALCTLVYAFAGPVAYVLARARRSPAPAPAS